MLRGYYSGISLPIIECEAFGKFDCKLQVPWTLQSDLQLGTEAS